MCIFGDMFVLLLFLWDCALEKLIGKSAGNIFEDFPKNVPRTIKYYTTNLGWTAGWGKIWCTALSLSGSLSQNGHKRQSCRLFPTIHPNRKALQCYIPHFVLNSTLPGLIGTNPPTHLKTIHERVCMLHVMENTLCLTA